MNDVPMPPRIAALERDSRGYPVPYIILRDRAGKPMFAANDLRVVARCIRDSLCHICGQALDPNPWFVGGPGAALLNGDHAHYNDGPMHRECMLFALQVCPHLLGLMARPVGPAVDVHLQKQGIATVDNTMIPGTPDVFVALQANHYEWHPEMARFWVRRPPRKTEYWRGGVRLPRDEGEKIAKRAARRIAAELGLQQR